MNNRYIGYCQGIIKCADYEKLLKIVENGDWFRTDSMDWYYISTPYRVRSGCVKPENVMCFHVHGVTSIATKYTRFIELEQVSGGCKIYANEELEDLICKDLTSFAKKMNPKTLRVSTTSFPAYLRAIPKDIFLRDGFAKRMMSALKKGFVHRMKYSASLSEADIILELAKKTLASLEDNFKTKSEAQDTLEKNSTTTFDEVKSKKVEQLGNIFDKKEKIRD